MKTKKPLITLIVAAIFLNSLITVAEASQSFSGTCLLEIKKKQYLNGPCPISMEEDGGFSIGASETEPLTYFATVSVTWKNVGEGFWNEEKGANHAHSPLGKLTRKGACWQNKSAKVCAWK